MNDGERAIKDEDCLGALGVCLLEGCFVLIRLARLDCDQLYSQLSAGLGEPRQFQLVRGHGGIDQHGYAGCLRH